MGKQLSKIATALLKTIPFGKFNVKTYTCI